VNQRDLFNGLLDEAPAVRTSELSKFFKPAPLDPPDGATETSPRPGVTISRDAFGVPYVRGAAGLPPARLHRRRRGGTPPIPWQDRTFQQAAEPGAR
jgi:hypothetical protein